MKETKQLDLCGEWALHLYPDEEAYHYAAFLGEENPSLHLPPSIPAQVPGSYELDLQRAGQIPDPYIGMNMPMLEEYEYHHLVYTRTFVFAGPVTGREFLQFDGVDTFATMYLNGVVIGQTDNMLIGHDLPATALRQGENRLTVHIEPTVLRARDNGYTALNLALKYNYDSLYVRKSPSMFGWDILPRMVSGGLWRPVSLITREPVGISQAYLYTESIPSEDLVNLILFHEVEIGRDMAGRYTVEVEGHCGDSAFSFSTRVWGKAGKARIPVKNPHLWWPRGYGEQPLYDVSVRLLEDGIPVDEQHFRIGLRIVKLHRTSIVDENGKGDFCFEINGRRVFLLGTNWVPPDAHHSLGDLRAPEILQQVEDIGCNAIRIWGGSRYELDSFYSLCDKKGIFIWHDFMMGCANYPQTPEFCAAIRREVTWVVRRLRHHPSICVWAGDNECDQNYQHQVNFTNPNDNPVTREVVYRTLLNEDYTRPYLPSSPYLDEECYRVGIQHVSEDHLWGSRRYYKAPYYRDATALFASEMGYHGCPSPDSLRRFLSPDKVWDYTNEEWLLHASCPDPKEKEPFAYRNELMANQVKILFGEIPDDLNRFALASQISQAEAMQFFLQHFRSRKGHCTGIIWWNIRDAWPQISDAVMDYYGTKKLAYTYIARCQQPVCLMFEERQEGTLTLYGVNDTPSPQAVRYTVTDADGNRVAWGKTTLPTDQATALESFPATADKRLWKIRWEYADTVGINSYLTGQPPYSLEDYVRQAQALGLLALEGFSNSVCT